MKSEKIALATRPEMRVGSDEFWDKAEAQMLNAARAAGVEPVIAEGDGAFYAPKLDFSVKDAIGREWTIGTIQLDYQLPDRLDAEYVAEDGQKHRPVMLHRAIVGSMERFIGVLIEHYAGAMPLWLAPVQAVVMNITDAQSDYARSVAQALTKQGFRVELDLRNEKINYKIRENALSKVPYLLVVGDQERAAGTIAVRARGNVNLGVLSLEALTQKLSQEVQSRGSAQQ